MVKFVEFMENEGTRIVMELLAMDVSVWKIAKGCNVSYQTAKAWKKRWWNPDTTNKHRLMALKTQILYERRKLGEA